MFAKLKKSWRSFERSAPGHRFEEQHEAHSGSASSNVVVIGLGILLLAGGVVLLFIPGPGLLLIAFGAGLIARQSLWLAKRLDRLELFLRKLGRRSRRAWERASAAARVAIAAALSVGALGAAYLGYFLIFAD